MTQLLGWSRLTAALLLLGFGLLAVFRVPHGVLWKPAVGATEWGHVLAAFALALLLGGWGGARANTSFGVAAVAAVLLLTPALRSIPAGRRARADLDHVFGDAPPLVVTSPGQTRTVVVEAADGSPLRMTLHGAGEGRRPGVIVVHGGSWNSGDDTQLPAINAHLAARGYLVAAVTYRLAPTHTFPAPVDDLRAAIRWLKGHADELGLDPERLVLLGRSAGGHLALATAYDEPDPSIRGVVALYPPTDLVWSWHHPTNPLVVDTPGTLSAFLGGPLEVRPDVYRAASPIDRVTARTVPTLLLHGGRDELVFPEQSERLAERLAASGVPHVLVSLPWATHGCDANLGGPSGRLYVDALESFLTSVFTDP